MQMKAQLTLKRLRRLLDTVVFAPLLHEGKIEGVKLTREGAPVNLQGCIRADMVRCGFRLISKRGA